MITATVYDQGSDSLSDLQNALVVTVNCPERAFSVVNKQLIFVVDVSGSMHDTMESLKQSLFAARNSLLSLMDLGSSENKDQLFSELFNVTLITFSDQARCIWQSQKADVSTKSFTAAVNSLESEQSTNMGAGLRLAFSRVSADAAWIIVLTDGISNKGDCQTVEAFAKLAKETPANTKVIPLGYTTDFDPEILNQLGVMTYLDSQEAIKESFAMIMGEFVSCYGIRAEIKLPVSDPILGVDDLITSSSPVNFIGGTKMGCVFNDRKYIFGRCWGQSRNVDNFVGTKGTFEYFDLELRSVVTENFVFVKGSAFPDNVVDAYFQKEKCKLVYKVYAASQAGQTLEDILRVVEGWTHPLSLCYKEEVRRLVRSGRDRAHALRQLSAANSSFLQTVYRVDSLATPSQVKAVRFADC